MTPSRLRSSVGVAARAPAASPARARPVVPSLVFGSTGSQAGGTVGAGGVASAGTGAAGIVAASVGTGRGVGSETDIESLKRQVCSGCWFCFFSDMRCL